MKKVTDVLSRKGHRVTQVSPNDSVLDALKIMADQNIGSVVVTENEEYLGIMTERDYSRKVVLKGKSSTDTMVGDIMSNDLPRVTEITPFKKFYVAENYHQDYYNSNGSQPYCYYVIRPKLEKFKKVFKEKMK